MVVVATLITTLIKTETCAVGIFSRKIEEVDAGEDGEETAEQGDGVDGVGGVEATEEDEGSEQRAGSEGHVVKRIDTAEVCQLVFNASLKRKLVMQLTCWC